MKHIIWIIAPFLKYLCYVDFYLRMHGFKKDKMYWADRLLLYAGYMERDNPWEKLIGHYNKS